MRSLVGLTGGIGAGKSTVAKLLRRQGIRVIDMDAIGRNVSRKSSVLSQLNRIAGIPGGKQQRQRLRAAIFSNPRIKKNVEKYLHPLIWKEFHRQARKPTRLGFVICEAALLIESHHTKRFKKLIVVMASKRTRAKRALLRDGISNALFNKISRLQCTDAQRRRKADYLILNDGSLAQLKEQTLQLGQELKTTFSAAKARR